MPDGLSAGSLQRQLQTDNPVWAAVGGPHLVGIGERVTRWGDVTLARLAQALSWGCALEVTATVLS